MKTMIEINNLPTNPERYTWFVCRMVDGEAWFYGAWYAHQHEGAARQAAEIGGILIKNEEV